MVRGMAQLERVRDVTRRPVHCGGTLLTCSAMVFEGSLFAPKALSVNRQGGVLWDHSIGVVLWFAP